MAGCSGGACRLGKGLKDLDWLTSLKDLLASSEGRSKLKTFLMENDFENELSALTFWEECNEIVCDYKNFKQLSSSGRLNDNATAELFEKANNVIVEYVQSSVVNLDEEMIERLERCLEERNPKMIADVFLEAKGWAHNLLIHIHSTFSDYLIKYYNLGE